MFIKINKSYFFALAIVCAFLSSTSSYADCTTPDSVEGGLEYYFPLDTYRYCDGTDWINWGDGGAITLPIDVDGEEEVMNYGGGTPTATFMRQIKADRSIAFGEDAGLALLDTNDAFDNMFAGYQAGMANTTGVENSFFGSSTGLANTTGGFNTFLGGFSGASNTTGSENVFVGASSGNSNTTGTLNTFSGVGSGFFNTTGTENVFLGYIAGLNNTIASYNTFIGAFSGFANTIGENNVFVGTSTGASNTVGVENSFFGSLAGSANTTGDFNTFLGGFSGASNTTGDNNVFVGTAAGTSNTIGVDNVFLGTRSGDINTTGNLNTFLGHQAGDNNTTGARNIIIGAATDNVTATTDDHLNIGDVIYGDLTAGRVGIGKQPDATAALDVNGDIKHSGFIIDVSDRRLKTNIKELEANKIKDDILSLNTYSFTMISDPKKRTEFGVMAQEIIEVFPNLVVTAEDEMKTMAVNYTGLIAPIIETVKVLDVENKALKNDLNKMQTSLWSLLGLIIISLLLQLFFIVRRKKDAQ